MAKKVAVSFALFVEVFGFGQGRLIAKTIVGAERIEVERLAGEGVI